MSATMTTTRGAGTGPPPIVPEHAAELERIGRELNDGQEGWVSRLARALEIDARTLRRMLAQQQGIRPSLLEQARAILRDAQAGPPEWLVAAGLDDREYLVRTQAPRFLARIVDELGGERYALGGLTYSDGGGLILAEFRWTDTEPANDKALDAILARGLGFVAEFYEQEGEA